MTPTLLVAAGLLAGGMNAMAGGGSFVSLPALIAAGLPSVTANATSSVALYPGGLASAWVYRGAEVRVGGVSNRAMLAVTILGGLIGALLLVWTPSTAFDRVLPWLLLLATLMLAFGQRLGVVLRGAVHGSARAILPVQFLLAVYAGYFGGAAGLMMMAAWSLLDGGDIRTLNRPRTLMISAANTVAILLFAAKGALAWPEAVIMGLAAMVGGYLGAHIGKRLPLRLVKALTVTLSAGVTILFFLRAYAG